VAIELTEQQRQVVQQGLGQPVEVVDPQTHKTYMLVPHELFDMVRPLIAEVNGQDQPSPAVSEGVRRSQAALRRALPELLTQPKYLHQWVAYHGEERIGVAAREAILLKECERRGLPDDEYYIGWIDPSELIEEEEVEVRPHHFADDAATQ
jgi:hypothetical protein